MSIPDVVAWADVLIGQDAPQLFELALLRSADVGRAVSLLREVQASGAPALLDGISRGWFMEEWKRDSLYIHEVQILPEFQGKGLGTAVVQGVIEQGARRTLPVRLSVVPANPRAKRLYERLGFEVTHVEPPFIRMRHQALLTGAV